MLPVIETLIQLTFVAIVLTVALEQIFDTQWWQKTFGKGVDGKPSRFFPSFELRPWVATILGIILAYGFQLGAIGGGLDIEVAEGVAWGSQGETVDRILTGLILGGGTKTIKKIGKQYGAMRKELQTIEGR